MTVNAILLIISIVCISIGLIMAYTVEIEQNKKHEEGKNH